MIVVALCVQVAGAAAQTKVEKQLSIRHHLSQAEIKISNSFFFNKYLKITSKTTVRIITIQSTIQYMELFFYSFVEKGAISSPGSQSGTVSKHIFSQLYGF
jgi:hypothetical protein